MSIRLNKKVVALTAGLTVLSSSMVSFAEEQPSVNNHQSISIQEQSGTDQLQVSEEQVLKVLKKVLKG